MLSISKLIIAFAFLTGSFGCFSFEISTPKSHVYYERVLETISCNDCDYIPKVEGAGQIFFENGITYQLMHNGVKVYKDSYCGSWMTDVIKNLRGHHEPQEEKVFFEVLKEMPSNAVMIELGSYWAYYSMWFQKNVPFAKNYLVEPGSGPLLVGKRNFALNNMTGEFIQAYIGNKQEVFEAAGVSSTTVDAIIIKYQIPFVDIIHSDIQGAEYNMLLGSLESIDKNKIGYYFISTHSHRVHELCHDFLLLHNFSIIAEHTPGKSFSVDGLIVARSHNLSGINHIEVSDKASVATY